MPIAPPRSRTAVEWADTSISGPTRDTIYPRWTSTIAKVMGRTDSDDIEQLVGMNPAAWGEEMRRDALESLAAGDWYRAYEDAKSWISIGGGAWILDPWLLYVASSLLQGQLRGAVHSVDMALENWIVDPLDRAILHWVRASIVHHRLRDPKTALADYERASAAAPPWLRHQVLTDLEDCKRAAERSRKRKPSIGPAPRDMTTYARDIVAPPQDNRPPPGSIPGVWESILSCLQAT